MKKLMAIVLLGAATISTSAFGWFGRGACCDTGCGSYYYTTTCCDTGCDTGCSTCGWW